MLPDFLTRPVLRLRADGGVDAPGPREAALGAPTLLLARGLCRFERFRSPAGLSRRAALAAARIHARTRAPFAAAGHALARTASGYGVWWWDAAQVESLILRADVELPVRLRPEAAAQAAEDGWRVLRGDGYEAQRWAGGSLEESAWRRAPFDAAAWSAFARLSSGDGAAAPQAPPTPRAAVFAVSPYARRFVRETDLRSALPATAVAVLVASLGATTFFLGQGLTAARRDGALRDEIARRDAAPAASRRPELAARARGLDALGPDHGPAGTAGAPAGSPAPSRPLRPQGDGLRRPGRRARRQRPRLGRRRRRPAGRGAGGDADLPRRAPEPRPRSPYPDPAHAGGGVNAAGAAGPSP